MSRGIVVVGSDPCVPWGVRSLPLARLLEVGTGGLGTGGEGEEEASIDRRSVFAPLLLLKIDCRFAYAYGAPGWLWALRLEQEYGHKTPKLQRRRLLPTDKKDSASIRHSQHTHTTACSAHTDQAGASRQAASCARPVTVNLQPQASSRGGGRPYQKQLKRHSAVPAIGVRLSAVELGSATLPAAALQTSRHHHTPTVITR